MNDGQRQAEYRRAAEIFHSRLSSWESCQEVVADFEELSRSIWRAMAGLLGPAGAEAVVERAIQLSARQSPLVQKVRVGEAGVDLGELWEHAAQPECSTTEAVSALLQLGTAIFQTLSQLMGDALVEPLLNRLEADQS